MENKAGIIQRVTILIVAIALIAASECRAFSYRSDSALRILSEYNFTNDVKPKYTHLWNIVPSFAQNGAATLRFFLNGSTQADVVCEIELPPAGSGGDIVWRGTGKTKEIRSKTDLLVVPGFPAPCDVLPVCEIKDENGVYHQKNEAGGRVFIKTYLFSISRLSAAEAGANGWIKAETGHNASLMMVTVTDKNGQLAVRQLWVPGSSWWLYEETPFRRSWLMN